MHVYNLGGEWQMQSSDGQHKLKGELPGTNYIDLMKSGLISDPFDKLNEKELLWVGETDWVYDRTFCLDDEFLSNKVIFLSLSGVDTLADITINGSDVAKTANAHMSYEFDVTSLLKNGENIIKIVFHSPVNYILKENGKDKMPTNMNGLQGFPYIRKPACHFGWDWGPTLPPSGIVGKIELVGYVDRIVIRDTNIIQTRSDSVTSLKIKATLSKASEKTTVRAIILAPNKDKIIEINLHKDDDGAFSKEIFLKDPQKWYANGMTAAHEQPLYTIILTTFEDTSECDTKEYKIGIRSIKLDRSKDAHGENFAFVVNGHTVFAKGANWIPADSFVNRLDDAKLEYLIRSMAVSNVNMVRVWGGGYYESDKFYDLCDKYGILVWQDFAFACAPYPFYDETFLSNVTAEVKNVVKRLRYHPSLALWCGNNEIEMMSLAWAARKNLTKYTEIFFYDILPNLVNKFDGTTAFINGSPTGNGYMKKTNDDAVGDTHLWHVWHGLQPFKYYRTRFTRFCSEFGFESLPDIDTVKSFTGNDDTQLDIVSETMQAHQKCNSGNEKMLYYAIDNFTIPDNFYDLIYITQLVQAESIKEAVEHWRRNKGQCNGALYWQFNDCWPTASWSSVDYYGRWKALQYYSKDFFAPIGLSIYDVKGYVNLSLSNETVDNIDGYVKLSHISFDGKVIHSLKINIDVMAFTVKNIENAFDEYEIDKKSHSDTFILAELFVGEKLISKKTLVMQKPNALSLKKADISRKLETDKGILSITLESKTYVHRVHLHLSGAVKPFSDNYFDLLPNETRMVKIPIGNLSTDTCEKKIKIICYNNLTPKYTKGKAKLLKAKIALMPMNILNRIYYKFS